MAEQFDSLQADHRSFIQKQKVFFVATAARDGRVNVSPKGEDSLAILSPTEILWLNMTGSGNETAAHLLDTNRMTLMWCAFDGPPLILRVYGRGNVVYPDDEAWGACDELIPATLGSRQYFNVEIELVMTSCGYGVPFYDFRDQRPAMRKWAEKKGTDGIEAYWRDTNAVSLDGKPTR